MIYFTKCNDLCFLNSISDCSLAFDTSLKAKMNNISDRKIALLLECKFGNDKICTSGMNSNK